MNRTTPVKVKTIPAKAPGAPVKAKAPTQGLVKPKAPAQGNKLGGPIKHKKILRDNIQGITNGAIQRLAHKGGVKYMSALSYMEVRGILKNYLETVISKTLIFTEHNRRRVVMERDVREALKSIGRPAVFGDGRQVTRTSKLDPNEVGIARTRVVKQHTKPPTTACVGYQGKRRTYHGVNPNAKVHKKFHIGGSPPDEIVHDQPPYDPNDATHYDPYNQNDDAYNANNLDNENETPYDPESPSDNEDDDEEYDIEDEDEDEDVQEGGAKKPRKFHPGTVSLRRIRYYQKQAGHCFNISKVGFRRLVREVAQDYKNDVRFTLDAMIIFQLDAEHYLVGLCSDAVLCTLHRAAARVGPIDFQLARRLRKDAY